MADVFISYSRRDKDFVQVLHQALSRSQYDTWVDWQDIPLTADWWEEIKSGIDAADMFVFVLSPDSVASRVCGEEVDYAVANQKRLVPIVRREGFDMEQVRPALGRHNWLFFREGDDFDTAFEALVTTLKTDLDHARAHTRLLVRAREWQAKQRDPDYLLRGGDLEEAEDWLTAGSGKQPYPTDLHREYISSARKAETLRQAQQRRRLRTFLAVVAGLAVVSAGLAVFALFKQREAAAQRERAYQLAKVTFARQLAAEAQDIDQNQLAQLLTMEQLGAETAIALGLAALPEEQQAMLQGLTPQRIAISKTGQFMAVLTRADSRVQGASGSGRLLAWNLSTKALVLEIETSPPLVDVNFSPDDQLLTATTQSGELRIWRVGSSRYELINTITAHSSPLTESAFSPQGRYLITADRGGVARVWDIRTLQNPTVSPLSTLLHRGAVSALDVSQDEQYVITGSRDRTLRLWAMDGQLRGCILHEQPVDLVRLGDDERYLGSVSGSRRVRIWYWYELAQEPTRFEGVQAQC
ncbi:MAG TPA: toll/interleukin-1 receptor domain-containing protein [Trichocoleus sp.]